MTLSEYCKLKNDIINAVETHERHKEILSSMKDFFRDAINSVRRLEQITSFGQLLQILEIRDFLSEDNVECLKNIALKLHNSKDVLQKITDYESNHLPRDYRNYYISSPQCQRNEPEDSFFTSSPLGSLSKRKQERIFNTIIQQIGISSYMPGNTWRVLARHLNIYEQVIQDIDDQYSTLDEKVTKILEKFIGKYILEPERWFFILCDALERTRRRDLVRSIQDIMVMNI